MSTVIVGEAIAGESAKVRQQLESLITSVNRSTFDIGELLFKVKKNSYYSSWGFNTFQEYVDSLDIKARKAQYLTRIVDVMGQVGVPREEYEPLGIAKLREIASLEPGTMYTNPETKAETPVTDFILGFIEKGKDMQLDEIKQHVKTLKGLTGSAALTWLNICVPQGVKDEVVTPAFELARKQLGTKSKDDDGIAVEYGDGACLEIVCVSFLNDPANEILSEG